VRTREGENLGSMELEAFAGHIRSAVDRRGQIDN